MPALLAGRSTAPNGYSRVVNTSSLAGLDYTINWEALKDGPARRKMSTANLYNQSKFVSDDSSLWCSSERHFLLDQYYLLR